MALGGVSINIGCGEDIRLGWINLDLNPQRDDVRRFDITSADDLKWLALENSKNIECNHAIGYVNFIQAKNLFGACFDSLEKKGRLVIEFPDIVKIANRLIEIDSGSSDIDQYIEAIRGVYAYNHIDAFNPRFSDKTYIFGYSANFVSNLLREIGFSDVKICPSQTHGKCLWRDTRIEAYK